MAEMRIVGQGEVLITLEKRLAPVQQVQMKRVLPAPPKGCTLTPCVTDGKSSAFRIRFKEATAGIKIYIRSVAFDIGEWSGETVRNMGPTLDSLKVS